MQDYVCAVRNPFARPKLFDGFVQSDANFRLFRLENGTMPVWQKPKPSKPADPPAAANAGY